MIKADTGTEQTRAVASLTFSKPSGLPVIMHVGSENVLPPSICKDHMVMCCMRWLHLSKSRQVLLTTLQLTECV